MITANILLFDEDQNSIRITSPDLEAKIISDKLSWSKGARAIEFKLNVLLCLCVGGILHVIYGHWREKP